MGEKVVEKISENVRENRLRNEWAIDKKVVERNGLKKWLKNGWNNGRKSIEEWSKKCLKNGCICGREANEVFKKVIQNKSEKNDLEKR